MSLILDSAHVLSKKMKPVKKGDRILLIMLTLVCLICGSFGIHHVLVLPLLSSFLIATILTILADIAYPIYIRREPGEKKVYSIRQFLLDFSFALLIFAPTHLSGVDLRKSLATSLYIFILIHWYYNFLPHRYTFTRNFVIFRVALIFFAMLYGWLTMVKANLALSLLIATLTSLAFDLDRRASVKLAETKSEGELEDAGKRAGAIFQPIGLIYGMLVGVMAASKIYGVQYFALWTLELYRLAYIFTPMFYIPFSVLSWFIAKRKK
ncbi:hypothetical protein DRP05_00425 [Archaeoglobales archaeon]|nr:MAG: hypothetical protein DRP05_00425 [Archaeoglobales archaeon]